MYFSYYAGLLLMSQSSIIINAPLGCSICLRCFDTIGWAAGRASGQ